MNKQIFHIAIFASGKGSNAEKIINYFKNSQHIVVSVVMSNKIDAPVLEMAKSKNVLTKSFTKKELENGFVEDFLVSMGIDFIVLAGFLLKIPDKLIKRFPNKIMNIHPSLLPKYGGKGMYGINVHQAVIENREKESGITIHLVNEEYDKGSILFQEKCPVFEGDTPEDLAKRVQILEHKFYAPCIEKYILNNG